jgi:hypothetical protein
MGRYIIEHITNVSKTILNQAPHHNYTNYHNYPGVRPDAPCGFLLIIPLCMLCVFLQARIANPFELTTITGTAYPSGTPEFKPGFKWGSCCSLFSFICITLMEVPVTRRAFLFVDRCLSFCLFSFGHC